MASLSGIFVIGLVGCFALTGADEPCSARAAQGGEYDPAAAAAAQDCVRRQPWVMAAERVNTVTADNIESDIAIAARKLAVANTRAQYASVPLSAAAAGGRANCTALADALTATNANTYNWMLWTTNGTEPGGYLDFVSCLHQLADVADPPRFWVTLIPPTETRDGRCSWVADSPLTPFNETALVRGGALPGLPLACNDYVGLADVFGRLAAQFPQLVALNIDDLVPGNIAGPPFSGHFTPEVLSSIRTGLKAHGAAWMSFIPTSYWYRPDDFVWALYPDLNSWTDGLLQYFLNSAQGPGPCAAPSCAVPRPRDCPGCLAGECAEPTAANAPVELRNFTSYMGNHSHILGFYASGHSSCGLPSAHYVDLLLGDVMPMVRANELDGVTVYTMQTPAAGANCGTDPARTSDKGCVVARHFGE